MDKASFPQLTPESFTGSDCSGSNGASNRILTTSDAEDALGEVMVIVGGRVLTLTTDYTVSGNDITFLKPVYNQHVIVIWYVA